MLSYIWILAVCAAVAFIIIMHKIGIRKFTGYSVHTDIIVSGVLTILFLGTFAGMLVALMAGIFVSLYLVFAKYFFGAERYSISAGWIRTDRLKKNKTMKEELL